jgi:hypothetical protein
MGDLHDELDVPGPRPRTPTTNRPAAPPVDVARAIDIGPAANASFLELQRLAGNASVSRLVARESAAESEADEHEGSRSPVLDVVGRGGGEPLAPDLRTEMEGRLGADFGGVRVHRDSVASESAKSVDAHAYTVGNDVVFRSDRWDPSSSEGKHTLAHELSHVVQQANGPVDGTPAAGGIRVSSPGDDFEKAADRSADAALAGPSPAAGPGVAAASSGPSAQLEPAEPDDEMERGDAFAGAVQRQSNRDAPNRPGEEEELEEEPEEDGQPSRSAQREAAMPGEEEIAEGDEVEPPPPIPKGERPEGELEEEPTPG